MIEFALNQKTLSHLAFARFLDVAAELGCVGVEPRDDLGRPFFDGIKASAAGGMARDRGLRMVGLSQVYPFNDWNADRRGSVARLIETAHEAGAETISLIPRVDQRTGTVAERAKALRGVLDQILPMLLGTEVVALVEPIGFSTSSMKHQREATVIEQMDAKGRLAIIHDTFQHALAEDRDIVVPHIRLVHISGVAVGEGSLAESQDAQRGLIDDNDGSGACGEIKTLLDLGYAGPFSFECTSPSVRSLPDPSARIVESIEFVRRSVGDSTQGAFCID